MYEVTLTSARTECRYDLKYVVQSTGDPSQEYYYFCMTKNVILSALPTPLTGSDLGTLEGTEDIDCASRGSNFISPPAALAPDVPEQVSCWLCIVKIASPLSA